MNDNLSDRSDEISALADGALQGAAFATAVDRLGSDPEARACWQAYHLVGDVLRCPELAHTRTADVDFLARLEARLGQEARPAVARPLAAEAPPVLHRAAANADSFRWKMVAGFASVAAVAAVGWNVFALSQPGGAADGMATFATAAPQPAAPRALVALPVQAAPGAPTEVAAAQAPGAEAPVVMLRNAQLDELLAAHNQAIGGAALQSQARFVRNANFQELPR